MKAFVGFVADQGRTYADQQETANKYASYKKNQEEIAKY
jgi:hypothetical protein